MKWMAIIFLLYRTDTQKT